MLHLVLIHPRLPQLHCSYLQCTSSGFLAVDVQKTPRGRRFCRVALVKFFIGKTAERGDGVVRGRLIYSELCTLFS